MATATVATAAGAAALLYYTLNRKLQSSTSHDDDENENLNVARYCLYPDIYIPLNKPELSFPIKTLVLTYEMILKPAFTVLVDHKTKYFLLLIRGTHSVKDTLTAVTGAVVPFHHTVVHEGGVSNLVLGYAHCGMVAAARWIAKLATPCLKKALGQYPDYKLKIVGHSLGGGTAALLTYVLREQNELSMASCVYSAPAACMTWELAESGNDFITSVINGADLVPTFSAAAVDDLRAEVTASAWLNDLRNQIERTRILSTVYRSASALGSRLPSISVPKQGCWSRCNSASSFQWYSGCDEEAQSMAHAAWTTRPSLLLSSWSCIGPRHRGTTACSNSADGSSPTLSSRLETSEPLISPKNTTREAIEVPVTSGETEWTSEIECCSDEMAKHLDIDADLDGGEDFRSNTREDRINEVELWQQLEHELYERGW
ncbi:hypothetical protein GH714_018341 [Hevea brasiliensis]|uniref:Fungal lipase-type domain-containing protein n=1 Tax=Hevea brasiliensis TaxID=3981 RepID=A0A6A6LKD8_HEVBR|nr:hypothetical protein GH714_018341 [Hevea brasiliensis]